MASYTPDESVIATKHVPGASVDDLRAAPFVWLGTVEEIRKNLRDHEAVFGIDRYTVRGPALSALRRILSDTA